MACAEEAASPAAFMRKSGIYLLLLLAALAACTGSEPTPTPGGIIGGSPDFSVLPLPTPKPAEEAVSLPGARATLTPGKTPIPTQTSALSLAPPVPGRTLAPTTSGIPSPTATPTAAALVLPVATPALVSTPTPTTTVPTPRTATAPAPTGEATPTQAPTLPGATETPIPTPGVTPTASPTPTGPVTPSPEATPTTEATSIPTATPSPTPTRPIPAPGPTATPIPTSEPSQLGWVLELKIDWVPKVSGLSNLAIGAKADCPGAIGCRGSALPVSPGEVDFFEIYLCHPLPITKSDCDRESQLSYSLLSPSDQVQRWVVEVAYSGQLTMSFSWDQDEIPSQGQLRLWVIDSNQKILMNNPPPDVPPYIFPVTTGDETSAFLICGEVVAVTNGCPENPWP